MPSISVIMCVYNEEDCLPESVESVLSQDMSDIEIIVVDDNSTDGSLDVALGYQKRDGRVLVIQSDKNMGPANARNLGLRRASGDYIAILDSDDLALPGRFRRQYEYLQQNDDIYLVGGYLVIIDGAGREKNIWRSECHQPTEVAETLPERNCMAHSTVMFRHTGEFFYREKFEVSEEYDLYLNMLTSGKRLANIPQCLSKYRLRPKSLSFQESAKIYLYASKAREFYRQRARKGHDEYDKFEPQEMLAGECHDVSVFNKINLALKMKDWSLARDYLREYRKDPSKSLSKYINYAVKIQIRRASELKAAIESFLGLERRGR